MTRRMGAPVAAGLLVAAAAAAAPAGFTVESHGATATVTARPLGDPAGGLVTVSVVSGARSASWEHPNLFLDEESGAPAAEILAANRRDYLFVRAYYSSGASCCWTLLVYDLAELQPVRSPLFASRSPIELVHDNYGCQIGAIATPVQPGGSSPTPPALSCFDGRTFSRTGTNVPAPFQAPSGPREPPMPMPPIPEFFRGGWEPVTAQCQPDGILTVRERRLSFAADAGASFSPRVLAATADRVALAIPDGGRRGGFWSLEHVTLPGLESVITIQVRHSETGLEGEAGPGCIYTRQ